MSFFITTDCTGCTACQAICPTHAIVGKKKHRHRIVDEACINCGACGRVCPANAVANPFGTIVTKIPRKEWLRPLFDLGLCMACHICIETCPVNALDAVLQTVQDLHPYPMLAREKDCMACGFCAAECPVDAVTLEKRQE